MLDFLEMAYLAYYWVAAGFVLATWEIWYDEPEKYELLVALSFLITGGIMLPFCVIFAIGLKKGWIADTP